MNFKNFCFLAFFDQTNSLALATKKVTEAQRQRGTEAKKHRGKEATEAKKHRGKEAQRQRSTITAAQLQQHRGTEAKKHRGKEAQSHGD